MPRSSLGFHTMTLSLNLSYDDVHQLIKDFKKYSAQTGSIQMYHVDKMGKYTNYPTNTSTRNLLPTNLKIYYYKKNIGIKWLLKYNSWGDNMTSYRIEATINPKILAHINDYITAATLEDMDTAIFNFNLEAERISPLLKKFEHYSINRIDYCLNFYVNELLPNCNTEQIMRLIKRGNIPSSFTEWTEYDAISHRTKSRPNSFYIMNSSVTINCYDKHSQLQIRSLTNTKNNLSTLSQVTLDSAKGIIRFEVQCKYHKIYALIHKSCLMENDNLNKPINLLSKEVCYEIISHYFNKTIGLGNWYTLHNAIGHILAQGFNRQKEERLITALRTVNKYRSIAKAKSMCPEAELRSFKATLKELSSLCINPVTIPEEWRISYIPNLLTAYVDKIQREQFEKEMIDDFLLH